MRKAPLFSRQSCRILTAAVIGLSVFAGCRPESLQKISQAPKDFSIKANPMGHLEADFCAVNPDEIRPDLKLVFAVDQSGSNKQGAAGSPGTDPTGNRRFGPLVDFATTADTDPSRFLAFYTFNTQVFHSFPFSTSTSGFAAAVDAAWHEDTATNPHSPKDAGYTDFVAMLNKISQSINADMVANCNAGTAHQIIYVAMLVSDGFPYLASDTPQPVNDILAAVDNLVKVPEIYTACVPQIVLHTGLYWNPDPAADPLPGSDYSKAKDLMTQMSAPAHGKGTYNEFPQGIDFGKFAVPNRQVKYVLRDAILKDMNTIWEDGDLKYDSDMDGLSDAMEARIGSKPFLKDSDGNGVSDFVEYKVFGKPCGGDACETSRANPFHLNLCKSYLFTVAADGTVSYPDSDHDGLNDCEEKLLNSRSDLFSTNGSWIPDFLLLLSGMNLVGDPRELNMDWDWDGLSNYQEIKGGTPVQTPNSQFSGLKPMNYNLQIVSQSGAKECYHLEVDNILALRPDDMLRLSVTDGSLAVDMRRVLRTVERRMTNYELKLAPADFAH